MATLKDILLEANGKLSDEAKEIAKEGRKLDAENHSSDKPKNFKTPEEMKAEQIAKITAETGGMPNAGLGDKFEPNNKTTQNQEINKIAQNIQSGKENAQTNLIDTKIHEIGSDPAKKEKLAEKLQQAGLLPEIKKEDFFKDPIGFMQNLKPENIMGILGIIAGGIGLFAFIRNWLNKRKQKKQQAQSALTQANTQRVAASVSTEDDITNIVMKKYPNKKHARMFSVCMEEIRRGRK